MMKNALGALIALALSCMISCSTSKKIEAVPATATPTPASTNPNQTQRDAAERAKVVSNVAYKLNMQLPEKGDIFTGDEEITFELNDLPENFALNFREGEILKLAINGLAYPRAEQLGGLVQLPKSFLREGENLVQISYQQHYAHDGRGLHRFEDPEDAEVYLYTQFEAFDANHMFPCFDQPDLKANFELSVTVPESWSVVSTSREDKIESKNGLNKWHFPPTAKISPYVFSLHTGPYKVWKSQAGNIPLRLFARKSLAPFIKTEEWFRPTIQGLKFYATYFGYEYPFVKYDQLIVPDFNAGAMENAAAITFSERYVHKGRSTDEERERLAGVILHEMAHMWFGDLVTMRWWNGLWLNESFATYMSALSMNESTEFKESWISFLNRDKKGAYFEDQLVTTHPIQSEVPDTDSSFVNFDAITYGKGASVLKQLAFYLGPAEFQKGVQNYFKKYAFTNTDLKDFVGSLQEASGKDLSQWSKGWLESPGVDVLEIKYKCSTDLKSKSVVTDFTLSAKAGNPQAKAKDHRTELALYILNSPQAQLFRKTNIIYNYGDTKVPELVGADCPDFVMANLGDNDYIKVVYDKKSMTTALNSVLSFTDDLVRAQIWQDLFNLVRDGILPVQTYVAFVTKNLNLEPNLRISEMLITNLSGRGAFYFYPQNTEKEKDSRMQAIGLLEEVLLQALNSSQAGSDWQLHWFDSLSKVTETSKGLKILADAYSGKLAWPKLVIDQDRRWNLLMRLNGFAYPHADEWLLSEKQKDPSERGVRSAISAEAIRPDEKTKNKLLSLAVNSDRTFPLAKRKAVFLNVFPAWQDQFRAEYTDQFYGSIMDLAKKEDPEFLHAYIQVLPTTCTEASLDKLNRFILSKKTDLLPVLKKSLLMSKQEEQTCLRARQAARSLVPNSTATP